MLIYLVAGARPNFMKIAPIVRALQARPDAPAFKIIHTGQHYDRELNDVFFEELGIPQPDVFMAAGGGCYAQQTAKIIIGFEELCTATRPDAVPALAMLCASPCFVRGPDWRHGVSADIFRSFADGLRNDYRGTLQLFIALEAFGSDHARDDIRSLRGELFARGEPAAEALAAGLELLETSDLRGALPALSIPSLWIAGHRDRLVDPRAMQAAADLAPNASVHVVEHAGHAPFLTHADDVAMLLADFAMEHGA